MTARDAYAGLTATAKYSGTAVGKYVTKTFTAGILQGGEAAPFLATVDLTAWFTTAADDDVNNRIGGAVTNFRDLQNESLGNWRVTLKDRVFTGTDLGRTSVNLGAETQGGLDTELDTGVGHWSSTFYGGANTGTITEPDSVIGEFDAHVAGGVAAIYGAYGAKKQDDD